MANGAIHGLLLATDPPIGMITAETLVLGEVSHMTHRLLLLIETEADLVVESGKEEGMGIRETTGEATGQIPLATPEGRATTDRTLATPEETAVGQGIVVNPGMEVMVEVATILQKEGDTVATTTPHRMARAIRDTVAPLLVGEIGTKVQIIMLLLMNLITLETGVGATGLGLLGTRPAILGVGIMARDEKIMVKEIKILVLLMAKTPLEG